MRIVHVIEPSAGGSAKQVRDLTRALLARGHEVDAIVARRDGFAQSLRELGAGVATIDFQQEITATGADLRSLRSLGRLLGNRRWDVVHSHSNKAGVLARPLARAYGMAVVHSPHGFAYVSQRRRPRRGMEARRTLTLWIERVLAPCADVILCVSRAERDHAIRDGIAAPDRAVVVHNGIEPPVPARPDPRVLAVPGEGPVIGFLARLDEGKEPLLFVEALALLRRRGVPFRGAIVGNGSLEAATRARVIATGLDPHVAVLPFEGETAAVLAAFDIYVLPTLWEAFGIGVLEAMAAGVPVVASEVGGVPEVVDPGRTGLLVPPGDVVALADAIGRLLEDPGLRQRMGESGRRRFEEQFGFEAMVDGTVGAYELALERRWHGRR